MLSDGYQAAAAQGRSGAGPATPGFPVPPLSSSPQSYAGPQPYGRPAGGQPPGQPPGGQAGYGPAVFGQPGLGTPATYSGQPSSYPGQAPSYPGQAPSYPGQGPSYPGQAPSYPGQQPGGLDALPGYAPGRRKPMSAEVPPKVHRALRLMYAGFVVTVLDVVLSAVAFGRYSHDATVAKNLASADSAAGRSYLASVQTTVWHNQNTMAGTMAIALLADLLGLACWVWLAMATRRGHGWTRIAGAVLLGIYSVCTLLVLFGTHHDPGPQFTTLVVWALGVATVFPLFSQQARDFFYAWRKR